MSEVTMTNLSDMLDIFADAMTAAVEASDARLPEADRALIAIGDAIELEHGVLLYSESLADGRDPFQAHDSMWGNMGLRGIAVGPMLADLDQNPAQTAADVRRAFRVDCDAALYRLASSGYAHRL